MGWFSSDKSWTNQAKGTTERTGLLPSGSWTAKVNRKDARKECPPVADCRVKNTLMASAREQRLWGVRTKKEVEAAKKAAAKVAAQQKRARSWPDAGKYDPKRKAR